MSSNYADVIIIGGGAAGLMCAATAAKRGRSVKVLDHSNKVGKKILMSGGGRCNFTNYYVEPSNYLSNNEHFCKSALSRFTQWDFIALVDKHKVPYHEKTLGQLFCDRKANDILQLLLDECAAYGAEITTHCDIKSVQHNEQYQLETSMGNFECASLVIATGGLSIPTMGATGFGYEIAKQFDLKVTDTQAALVPFTISDRWLDICKQLSGASVNVVASNQNDSMSFTEALLFTHRGLSGPAILQISNYWNLGEEISIDFMPNFDLKDQLKTWRQSGNTTELKKAVSRIEHLELPKKFVQLWLEQIDTNKNYAELKPADLSDEHIANIEKAFKYWRIKPSGTEGWRTAEVTRGGVCTNSISSKTFEVKNQQGLYFIGEVLDVTGWLGGFNFQWAWASGWCAGQYV